MVPFAIGAESHAGVKHAAAQGIASKFHQNRL